MENCLNKDLKSLALHCIAAIFYFNSAQEYGELANECSDVYYSYGKALLELHRLESTTLGNVLKSDDDDAQENENDDNSSAHSGSSEELVDEEYEEYADNKSAKNSNGEESVKKIEKSSEQPQSECTSNNNNGTCANANESNDASTSKLHSKELEEEDVSSLQLAWEVLELAKVIYLRQNSSDAKLKLSDTYFRLGDVSLESERFEDAVKDYERCLNLQQEHLPCDSRLIAETLYQLGLGYTLKNDYKPASEFFHKTIELLEKRKDRLKKVSEGVLDPRPDDAGDGFYTPIELADREIVELEALIKEIYLKIDEIKDEECNAVKVSILMKESLTPTKQSTSSTAVTNDENCTNSKSNNDEQKSTEEMTEEKKKIKLEL
ncbi:hypothetical protein HELRODRAFT_162278 [Helobdella robusta]|uniref:Tetratricopeptide SHNi-TPR domain-containing protein n=1 Tax=Helobdella robusta TaxID=6412 RepID=T1ESG0_HELRO|nr:hypothetical protein HELRODRAFT_162278 [Helobdella robusta]ESN98818.1 hypothetical protein HELRODRAFT_162278 [Helobdella robusta]